MTDNPDAIVTTLWFNCTVHFGMRGREGHYNMKWGDVKLKKISSGDSFLEYHERATKTRTGQSTDTNRKFMPKIFASPGMAMHAHIACT